MSVFFTRLLMIISLSSCFFTCCAVNPAYASPDGQERLQLRQSISSLHSDAQALAQELLLLDIKKQKAVYKRDLVKKDLDLTAEKRDQALIQYNKALEAKQHALATMKPWINFQYRYGYWSLVDCILGSSSLSDLIGRATAVSFIVGRQVKDFIAADHAREESRQKEIALKEAVDELGRQSTLLEQQVREIESTAYRRKAYFEEIKRNSSDLAVKVAEIENRLLYSLDLYNFLTGAMSKIPWMEISPDNSRLSLDGIILEMSEKSLNGLLQSAGDEDLKRLSVSLQQGTLALSGKDSKSSSTFTLSGVLTPDENLRAVTLDVKGLSLDGTPVSGEVLGQLTDKTVFQMPLPEEMKLFRVSGINISDGNIIITLKLQ